jgi:hypothetical protein
MELRDPSYLGTPIPPSNLGILNTHKELFIHNDIILFLDVWDITIPPLWNYRVPHAWEPQFHLQTPEF